MVYFPGLQPIWTLDDTQRLIDVDGSGIDSIDFHTMSSSDYSVASLSFLNKFINLEDKKRRRLDLAIETYELDSRDSIIIWHSSRVRNHLLGI